MPPPPRFNGSARGRALDALNLSGLALALALSAWGARAPERLVPPGPVRAAPPAQGLVQPTELGGGQRALLDAAQAVVPIGPYARIVSASSLADEVLLEVCDPQRIVAFTERSQSFGSAPQRYRGRPGLAAGARLSRVLELAPDLVLVSGTAPAAWVAQLRQARVRVFDLGPMLGVSTLSVNIEQIGFLCGEPERARRVGELFRQRLERVAPKGEARPTAIYLSVYGQQLFGGTRGSSYHDVLQAAGLEDVAARRFEGWPGYRPEQVLELAPEFIVTSSGQGRQLCALPIGSVLSACRGGKVIEVEEALLSDPGLSMLEAAEAVAAALRGKP